MRCPSCGEDDDKVLESRAVRGGAAYLNSVSVMDAG